MATARTPQQEKRLASLVAEFALRGIEVHFLADGGFLIVRRGATKHCATLAQLEAAARQILGVTA